MPADEVKAKPKGEIVSIRAEQRKRHRFAVYARIICVDEDGREWYFDTSAFNFDLKLYPEPE